MKNIISTYTVRYFIGRCLLVMLVLLPLMAQASIRISSVRIDAGGKVLFFCNEKPIIAASELSPTKDKITLTFANTVPADNLRDVAGKGFIENIILQQEGVNLSAYIFLRQEFGYASLYLPYSDIFYLYLVNWKNLTPAENQYYQGLLAYESNATEQAREYFQQAARYRSADAQGVLGLLLAQEGAIADALPLLTLSVKGGTELPDVYACLSEIYANKNNFQQADLAAKRFTQLSGRRTFRRLLSAAALAQDSGEPSSSALSLLEDIPTETGLEGTLFSDSTPVTPPADSAAKPAVDTTKKQDSASQPFSQRSWLTMLALPIGVLVLTGTAIAVVAFLVLKRRKKTPVDNFSSLINQMVKEEEVAANPTASATNTVAPIAVPPAETTALPETDKPIIPETDIEQPTPPLPQQEQTSIEEQLKLAIAAATSKRETRAGQQPVATEKSDVPTPRPQPTSVEEFFSSLQAITGSTPTAPTEEPSYQQQIIEPQPAPAPAPAATPPQQLQQQGASEPSNPAAELAEQHRQSRAAVEMALNIIAKRKEAEKKDKSFDIEPDDIPDRPYTLAQVAKQLGVEKGALEIKKNLSTLSNPDEEEQKKKERLSSLFGKSDASDIQEK